MPFSIRPYRRFPVPLQFVSTLVLSLVCLATPAWAEFQAGIDAYNRGDYAPALREIRPLAEKGDADAQSIPGLLYDNGRGVPQDYAKARQWYEKAAAQGDTAAQTNLGLLYYAGEGVPQDYQQALRWFCLLADQGDAHGQVLLGSMYQPFTQSYPLHLLPRCYQEFWPFSCQLVWGEGRTSCNADPS